jgi:hypothetical protein
MCEPASHSAILPTSLKSLGAVHRPLFIRCTGRTNTHLDPDDRITRSFRKGAAINKQILIGDLAFFWTANFFLHVAWENWQILFYSGMADARHADAVWLCTRAAFGDANIALLAYVLAALTIRSWRWPLSSSRLAPAAYIASGIAITVIIEHFATEVWNRWHYSDWMPVLPLLGTGVLPLLQWLLIPLLSLSLAKMKIRRS